MRIFLVGFMASGKSTVGRKLANKMNLPFIDLDDYIEEKHKKTIRYLMYELGMDAFRDAEKSALEELIQKHSDILISTGGGTPCFYDNMSLLNKSGRTVYLEVDIPTLVDRIMNSKKDRPLIWGKSKEDLTVYANDLLSQRQGFYKRANHTVSGKSLKLDSILELFNS